MSNSLENKSAPEQRFSVQSSDQLHPHPLGTCEEYKFLSPTPDLLNQNLQNLWGWSPAIGGVTSLPDDSEGNPIVSQLICITEYTGGQVEFTILISEWRKGRCRVPKVRWFIAKQRRQAFMILMWRTKFKLFSRS